MKVFARAKDNNDLFNYNIYNAVEGFHAMGKEIVKYSDVNDIVNYLCKSDIVLDGIQQVRTVLRKWGADCSDFDYPESMREFLGRKVWKSTIGTIVNNPDKLGFFVKPMEDKRFTGRIVNELRDLIGCYDGGEEVDVWCSEALDIRNEYRAYVRYDKIIDIRPYKGDYHYQYNANTVDRAMKAFEEWEQRPMGCSVDFGVTADNKTVLIEVNDGYSLGSYGLDQIKYAKLISARWAQLTGMPDECAFDL